MIASAASLAGSGTGVVAGVEADVEARLLAEADLDIGAAVFAICGAI